MQNANGILSGGEDKALLRGGGKHLARLTGAGNDLGTPELDGALRGDYDRAGPRIQAVNAVHDVGS